MEENTIANTDTGVNQSDSATVTDTTGEVLSMSKVDYEKAIQSAEDKVRSAKTKEIKALQAKIAELSPPEKSQADVELEKRLAVLEEREKATAAKEQMINMQATLSAKGLAKSLADYLKSDIDIDTFGTLIDEIVNERTKGNAYVPTGHQSNVGLTKDDFKKMSYSAKVKLQETNPELVKQFMGK